MTQESLEFDKIELGWMEYSRHLKNYWLQQSWRNFHAANARLRYISKAGNKIAYAQHKRKAEANVDDRNSKRMNYSEKELDAFIPTWRTQHYDSKYWKVLQELIVKTVPLIWHEDEPNYKILKDKKRLYWERACTV
jgi:hypothetical protein